MCEARALATDRGTSRKPGRRRLLKDARDYREIIERAPALIEEVPELELARTAEEQIEACRESDERIVREGRA